MSNVFTLDSMREEAERRYAPTKIELSDGSTVELKSVLKLKKPAREAVQAALKEIDNIDELVDEDDEDSDTEVSEIVCEAVSKIFRLICGPAASRRLIAELEHDDPQIKATLHTSVLTKWIGETQLGGSRVLASLIDKHGEAILSDLLHHYQLDLRLLWSEEAPLSPRYVLALIMQLPTDGAFYASRRGGIQFRGWDADRYALVAAVNALRANNHILTVVNRDPAKPKPKPPEPFPTPDSDTKSAPKPGSFAHMIVAAKRAHRLRKEKELNG
ncbi:tail assembly chaperone [Mycobacterium phage Gail]|uniref:Tail assembly chaperone n=1 Tax=Mycobacterium phage Gail TaxID=2743994 RepID=A0A7D5FTH1_9CAUD|nr:tail assembly chaperone [Mycobacterium phage Gail]QLF84588.1 tail assembly chaperone [Mycobacterium phage Gail]